MIRCGENILIGNSFAETYADVEAVLNVAVDLRPTRSWTKVVYVHVGLIDGPGNPLSRYCAAVLALASLRGETTLVCCHEGRSRSVAVALMYLAMTTGRSWTECLAALRERNDCEIPEPHEAHRAAFDLVDWEALRNIAI